MDNDNFHDTNKEEGSPGTATTWDGHNYLDSEELVRLQKIRTKLGLFAHGTMPAQDHLAITQHHLLIARIRFVLREPLAEFMGTMILVLFGCGSVAQVVLGHGLKGAPDGQGFGEYQSISWGWGIGLMLGLYVAGDSGGFLNPAVTFAFNLYRGFPWRRFPIYFFAQFMGGFVAAAIIYANYVSAINNFDGGVRAAPPSKTSTAQIFCTYPQAFTTRTNQFFSEFITSALLQLIVFALKDESNQGAMGKTGAGAFFPLILFFMLFGLGACFGLETGYAINLARDLGPRLMSYILGYPNTVFTTSGGYPWIPCVAPFFGCAFGGFLYDLLIYTGDDSPLNQPGFGIERYRKAWREKRAGTHSAARAAAAVHPDDLEKHAKSANAPTGKNASGQVESG